MLETIPGALTGPDIRVVALAGIEILPIRGCIKHAHGAILDRLPARHPYLAFGRIEMPLESRWKHLPHPTELPVQKLSAGNKTGGAIKPAGWRRVKGLTVF